MAHGILVAFPGTGYTCKEPLIAACVARYRAFGYDTVCLDPSSIPFKQIETVDEAVERAKPLIRAQLSGVRFDGYRDVVLLSKSLGTICAGWLVQALGLRARQLYLTPVREALPYIGPETRIMGMVIGTEGRLMDAREIETLCAARRAPCLVIPGVGHSLKAADDAQRTAEINRAILELCTPL